MQVQILKPFLERALSPKAFQQNEYITMPDKVAKGLIKRGLAVSLDEKRMPQASQPREDLGTLFQAAESETV